MYAFESQGIKQVELGSDGENLAGQNCQILSIPTIHYTVINSPAKQEPGDSVLWVIMAHGKVAFM